LTGLGTLRTSALCTSSLDQVAPELAGVRRRRGKGSGNAGKPGKKLKLEQLQAHFGVGLKEAAGQLGICATTLKRACRRHGEPPKTLDAPTQSGPEPAVHMALHVTRAHHYGCKLQPSASHCH
jgi:RWP-RK domain